MVNGISCMEQCLQEITGISIYTPQCLSFLNSVPPILWDLHGETVNPGQSFPLLFHYSLESHSSTITSKINVTAKVSEKLQLIAALCNEI